MRRAALLALAAAAHADGKFVSTAVPVVEIPDQQAILVWREGRERLVIDTAHSGEGDLAWIVPLPAPPRIEPASPAVFRTLEAVTMPDLQDEPSEAWVPGLVVLLAILFLAVVRFRFAAVVAAAAILLAMGLLLVSLIPKSSSAAGVTVIDRGSAGSYDTATVEAVDAQALLSWLSGNGFETAPDVRGAIEEYVRDGWVFSVARLKPGGHGGRAHPLSFEFATKEPVYPMRLTGTQERPLALRLFILSNRRARCDGLAVESCYATGPPLSYDRGEGRRPIGQPELLGIAGGATVLTTLRGEFRHARSDLRLAFEEYEPLVPVVFSEEAARSSAATTAVWLAIVLLAPCCLVAWVIVERRKGLRHVFRAPVRLGRGATIAACCIAIDLGLVAGAVEYATIDVVETRSDRGMYADHQRARHLAAAAKDMEQARAAVTAFWLGRTNPYDGRAVREEPSPGNFGLELRDGVIAYLRYEQDGTPREW